MITKRQFGSLGFLALAFCFNALAQDRIDVSNTEEILITPVRTSETYRDRQKGDEALLIQDKPEIAKLVSLFDKNVQAKVHACGYHWRLTFNRGNLPPTVIYFNEECEEFERNTEKICEIVQAKFRQTVMQPNAYVTTLEIDVNVLPETARGDLKRAQMRVLSLREVHRLPYIELQASSKSPIPADRSRWNAEKAKVVLDADQALVNDIARIREKHKVVEIGQIMHSMSMFGGGEIMEQRRVKVYFDVGANFENVGKLLNKSTVGSTVTPSTYILQVLTPERLSNSERDEWQKRFPFIKKITAF